MSIIGLTGILASGKSTVLKFLKTKGAFVFDIDKKIHDYYQDKESIVYQRIAGTFPQSLTDEGISREVLARIVFSDRDKLKMLESIVHPLAIKDLKRWIEQVRNEKEVCVAEVPLLFEKKLEALFDKTVLVFVDKKTLIERIIKKYNFSQNESLNRLALYLPIEEKIKQVDFVINNSLGVVNLKKEVDLLWQKVK